MALYARYPIAQAPGMGENGAEILSRMGFSHTEITALAGSGALTLPEDK